MPVRRFLHGLSARFRGSFGMRRYLRVRRSLLDPPLATQALDLAQLRNAARGLCGDPADVRVYGMETDEWYRMGIRLLGRTVVEAVRDPQAAFIAAAAASTLEAGGFRPSAIVDLFVGSGNLLHHFVRETGASRAVGFDVDPAVLGLTTRNIEILSRTAPGIAPRLELVAGDWQEGLESVRREVAGGATVMALIEPPWGEAYTIDGLDLRRTSPPIPTVLEALRGIRGPGPLFAVVKTIPAVLAESYAEIAAAYDVMENKRSPDAAVASRVDYLLIRIG